MIKADTVEIIRVNGIAIPCLEYMGQRVTTESDIISLHRPNKYCIAKKLLNSKIEYLARGVDYYLLTGLELADFRKKYKVPLCNKKLYVFTKSGYDRLADELFVPHSDATRVLMERDFFVPVVAAPAAAKPKEAPPAPSPLPVQGLDINSVALAIGNVCKELLKAPADSKEKTLTAYKKQIFSLENEIKDAQLKIKKLEDLKENTSWINDSFAKIEKQLDSFFKRAEWDGNQITGINKLQADLVKSHNELADIVEAMYDNGILSKADIIAKETKPIQYNKLSIVGSQQALLERDKDPVVQKFLTVQEATYLGYKAADDVAKILNIYHPADNKSDKRPHGGLVHLIARKANVGRVRGQGNLETIHYASVKTKKNQTALFYKAAGIKGVKEWWESEAHNYCRVELAKSNSKNYKKDEVKYQYLFINGKRYFVILSELLFKTAYAKAIKGKISLSSEKKDA